MQYNDSCQIKFIYNKQGFVKEENQVCYTKSNIDTLNYRYEYTYDNIGNWIFKIKYLDESLYKMKYRIIEY